jgi:hypothetical protein
MKGAANDNDHHSILIIIIIIIIIPPPPPGWAAVPWCRGRWGGGGVFSWTSERQDRGAAMLLQVKLRVMMVAAM